MFAFIAALQFLSVTPPLIRRPLTPLELGQAVGYFPAVGLLLGALLAGLDMLLVRFLPLNVAAALLLATWVVMTGALHLDGWLDTCDGLWGGQTPEERLRILRDERVGAFAVAGGVLLLLVKYSALAAAPVRLAPLLLAPALGRWSMALAVVAFPYARAKGLGRAMKAHATWQQAALATGVALAAVWFAAGWTGVAALVATALATWAGGRYAVSRLSGLTGDVYGALCEVTEVLVLLFFVAG